MPRFSAWDTPLTVSCLKRPKPQRADHGPLTDVYVPIDLCNANKGRLHIQSSGVVDVEAEGGTFSNAECFTSLDGASFVQ